MHEVRQEPGAPSADALDAANWPGGPNEGDWVLLGTLAVGQSSVEGLPVMEPKKRMVMRRYRSPEEAIGASVCHSATRVNGGWVINVRDGRTVRFGPFQGERHV